MYHSIQLLKFYQVEEEVEGKDIFQLREHHGKVKRERESSMCWESVDSLRNNSVPAQDWEKDLIFSIEVFECPTEEF